MLNFAVEAAAFFMGVITILTAVVAASGDDPDVGLLDVLACALLTCVIAKVAML